MDDFTFLEVVLELESLPAVGALEPPEDGGLVVRDHVPLQPVHVGELLMADLAHLQAKVIIMKRTSPLLPHHSNRTLFTPGVLQNDLATASIAWSIR